MSYTINRMFNDSTSDDIDARTQSALADHGFGILTEIDVKATMKKKLDVEMPSYVVAANTSGVTVADVGLLLGAQTAGALMSNPIWGKLGDGAGKLRMLQTVAVIRILPPLMVLALLAFDAGLWAYMALFMVIGAMMNGVTIGYLGYLMEISPDDRRPAYSAYFNALASPAALALSR